MKIAIQGQAAVEAVCELLSPWEISFSSLDEAEVVIVYGEKLLENKKAIVIPSDSSFFMKWVKDLKFRVVKKLGKRVSVATSSQTILTITPQMLYYYDKLGRLTERNNPPTATELDRDQIFLTLDIVKEYRRILDETLNAKSSTLYRLLTDLPIPYTLAPRRLRDMFMRRRDGHDDLTFCDKLPIDALRFIIVRAIEKLSGKELQRKTWNGKRYACVLTHDIDTRKGFQRAKRVKSLEEKYDVPSAWYVPSKHYKLESERVKELANHGEIGAHGTRHDGKLTELPEQELVMRLYEAKLDLEKLGNCSVEGFRAPLLQHSLGIIRGLKEVGYAYDTSMPTWEPKHPRTMRPHGIGTTYPMFFDSFIEIPVSLVQDHQLLFTWGLAPKEIIHQWLSMMAVIKDIGGCCVLLTHPGYKLFDPDNLLFYEELLNTVISDPSVWLTTPKQLVKAAFSGCT